LSPMRKVDMKYKGSRRIFIERFELHRHRLVESSRLVTSLSSESQGSGRAFYFVPHASSLLSATLFS
jgi:hypothetical protein